MPKGAAGFCESVSVPWLSPSLPPNCHQTRPIDAKTRPFETGPGSPEIGATPQYSVDHCTIARVCL